MAAHSTPPTTSAPPASSSSVGRSPKAHQAALIPTTGTSMENGATTPAGCRVSSQTQIPDPTTVPRTTV